MVDLLSAAQGARIVAEQHAYAERTQRMESEALLLWRIDESDHAAAAARAARQRAERAVAQAESLAADAQRRAERAEALAAGLERLLRDDTARCAHVYDAVQRLRGELAACRMYVEHRPAPPFARAPEPVAAPEPHPAADDARPGERVLCPGPPAHEADLAALVEPDRLAAALTRLQGATPAAGAEAAEPASRNRDGVGLWRALLHRFTRRLA